MNGFVGEYLHTLDSKGRVALPVKFRESLGPRFIVARGLDKCLFVYPSDEWAQVMDKLKTIPINQKDSRNFTRYFLSGATELNLINRAGSTSRRTSASTLALLKMFSF